MEVVGKHTATGIHTDTAQFYKDGIGQLVMLQSYIAGNDRANIMTATCRDLVCHCFAVFTEDEQ